MDELIFKDDTPRVHPEDAAHNSDSDRSLGELDCEDTSPHHSADEDYKIPGTGPQDRTMFKSNSRSQFSGKFNTGVKGVIADAHSFESARRNKARSHRREESYAGYNPREASPTRALNNRSSDESGDDDDDEDFVRTWRKSRMAELREKSAATRRRSPSKRKYGTVEEVDAAGYLDAVDKVGPETVVVVTIYNDENQESRFVADCLHTLARRYVTTRFIKLHYTEAEMDAAVTPAVLAYKGGDLFANIMRIVDEIPPGRNLSSESLELVLKRENVLQRD
ncbi:thioredoxin-like protein [Ascodesmis nigricans]|uniref:Thioredoxin-like protein n=1 Tax=Ascodesmis nigricans TaxID=341454 RepID=A0A4S2N6D4_9PEZI|nr:thioredoxin-like protein [Ascodesmis nigricans]